MAASTSPRRGVAASVARIMPVPYSVVTTSAPRTTAVIWANIIPQVTNEPGDSSASPLASHSAAAAQIRTVRPAPSTNMRGDRPQVERTDQNLIHSARRVAAKPGCRTPGTFAVSGRGRRCGRCRSWSSGDPCVAVEAVVLDAVGGQGHEGVLERGAHEGQLVQEQAALADELADGRRRPGPGRAARRRRGRRRRARGGASRSATSPALGAAHPDERGGVLGDELATSSSRRGCGRGR